MRGSKVMRISTIFIAAATIALASAGAEANSGRMDVQDITPVWVYPPTIPAHVTASFETFLESGDSVLHVQDDAAANGSFIAGNDDCPGEALRSCVTVPAVGFHRSVRVIVRAYCTDCNGSGTLVVKHNSTQVDNMNISFGGLKLSLGSLPAGSHVFTTRRLKGIKDTVLLVMGASESIAVNYDNDDGVGKSSWVHLEQTCLGNCCDRKLLGMRYFHGQRHLLL